MTPVEVIYSYRLVALLCAWILLGGLLGLAVFIEIVRPRDPDAPVVSGYTIAVSVAAVTAVAYMLAGDTP